MAWEAQFGDFANGAQIVIDQFITAGHGKWGQASGLVMLLPHGYEGQGPEHSSARDRAVPHPVRRRQHPGGERHDRGPVLPRAAPPGPPPGPPAAGRLHAQVAAAGPSRPVARRGARAGRFKEVVDDASDPSIRRPCGGWSSRQGKVAYDAMAHRDEHGLPAAVVRVEQLYPWPEMLVLDAVSRYSAAREVVWLQEEPENMGPWNFVHGRLHRLLRDEYTLRHVSRPESASPASGSHTVHQRQLADLLDRGVRRSV